MRNLLSPFRCFSTSTSSEPSSKYAHLLTSLPKRRLPVLHDYLTPQPSYLLSITVAPFLSQAPSSGIKALPIRLPSIRNPPRLPPAHHIAYFPSPVPTTSLLPDGTDTLHSPGPPFTRRLWAGGSIQFPAEGSGPLLNGQRAVCVEGIRDVQIKGPEDQEKIFVGIERRVALLTPENEAEDDETSRSRIWTSNAEEQGDAVIIERRNLVFLQPSPSLSLSNAPPPPSDNPKASPTPRRSLEPPTNAFYATPLTPTPALLFRYSALMFNAHTVHLDRTATRNVERQPDLLVHGPLSLTLMLEGLQRHLLVPAGREFRGGKKSVIRNIEYRNLQPLYCGEEMKVCGKPRPRSTSSEGEEGPADEWDVWIESSRGLAVKGVVTVV